MKLKIPNTFTIIFLLIIIVAILTWILPAGQFERVLNQNAGQELVIAGTYKLVEAKPQGFMSVFTAFSRGIIDSAEVISFVLIVGGAYGVILKTGSIENGLKATINSLGTKGSLLIPIIMFLFSVAGTTTGMWEETLPFYLIMIPLMITLGYDALVGVAVILLGAATGTMASTVNPFATGIASGIAGISIRDGLNTRIILYVISIVLSIIYVMWYANKVKKNPSKSIVYDLLADHKQHFNTEHSIQNNQFTLNQKIILAIFSLMIIFMVYSIIALGWFMKEITVLFLVVAILSAFLSKMKEDDFWNAFISGSKELLSAVLIIGIARGIVLVAQDGFIMDTILNNMSNSLASLSAYAFVLFNEFINIGLAFLVPSSSGHAALTMPVLAPLADLLNIKREIIVTTFQTASGLVNMITPTSGVLIAALAIGRITWVHWVKFVLPLLGIQLLLVLTLLIFSV